MSDNELEASLVAHPENLHIVSLHPVVSEFWKELFLEVPWSSTPRQTLPGFLWSSLLIPTSPDSTCRESIQGCEYGIWEALIQWGFLWRVATADYISIIELKLFFWKLYFDVSFAVLFINIIYLLTLFWEGSPIFTQWDLSFLIKMSIKKPRFNRNMF